MILFKSIKERIGRRLDALVINFRRFLPLLHLYVEMPFVSIRTALMAQAFEKAWRQYLVLHVQVWKWSFEFELYDTHKRIYERQKMQPDISVEVAQIINQALQDQWSQIPGVARPVLEYTERIMRVVNR